MGGQSLRRPAVRVGLAGLALLLASLLVWVGVSIANKSARTDLREVFSVLDEPQQVADVPAEAVFSPADHGQGGVDAETIRLIGARDTTEFFVAEDAVANVCLIVVDEVKEFTAVTCAPVDYVTEQGLGLKATYLQYVIEAFLLPDGAHADIPTSWEEVGENLVLVRGGGSSVRSVTATSAEGRRFELHRYSDPPPVVEAPSETEP